MKTLVLSILAVLINTAVFSQDTLYTKNNSVVNAKVLEINQNEIKYKKASNPDGPIYTMSTSDLVLIHFKNGTKEVFSPNNSNSNNKVADGSNSGSATQPTVINNYPVTPAYGRPRVNVMIGSPYWGFTPWWGWGSYWGGYYYRPHHSYGSYYHGGGYHGGGGGYHGGGGGHYGPRH